jgi:hypothetical protein
VKFSYSYLPANIPKQLKKLGIWQGGALDLNQAKPSHEQRNFKKLDAGGFKLSLNRRSQKPIFQVVWVCN